MSIREMSRIWEESNQSGNALLLLLALGDYADENGYCWPGIQVLAHKTRMSTRSVMRMINDLVADKELHAIKRRNTGNKYIVLSGCSAQERERRVALLSDNLSRYVTDCHLISDTVMSHDPSRNINKETPFVPVVNDNGSGWDWIYLMYLDVFKEAVSSGEYDSLRELAQVYTKPDVKEAMSIAHGKHARQRLTRKVAYMRGILQDWAKNGKPEHAAQQQSEGTPIRPRKVYR
jgi:hypothetical protein